MSIESAMAALDKTPATTQPQAITPNQAAAATVEAEAKSKEAQPKTEGEAVVETKPTTEPEKKTEEPLSAKFAALTKKEKSIVQKSQELKTRETTLSDREAALASREAKIKASEALWETDMFAAIKERTGLDYNGLTMAYLDGKTAAPQETDPVKLAKKTIDDFKKEQSEAKQKADEEAKKAQEAAAKKQEEDLKAAWEAYNEEVRLFIEDNKDTYELINTYAQQGLIAETVDEFYKKNKRVLSVKEASDMVESYLESEAEKALNTKKISGKVKPAAATAPAKKDEEPRITKTLNNNMQPTSASVLPAQSEADRMKRAMAALNNSEKR